MLSVPTIPISPPPAQTVRLELSARVNAARQARTTRESGFSSELSKVRAADKSGESDRASHKSASKSKLHHQHRSRTSQSSSREEPVASASSPGKDFEAVDATQPAKARIGSIENQAGRAESGSAPPADSAAQQATTLAQEASSAGDATVGIVTNGAVIGEAQPTAAQSNLLTSLGSQLNIAAPVMSSTSGTASLAQGPEPSLSAVVPALHAGNTLATESSSAVVLAPGQASEEHYAGGRPADAFKSPSPASTPDLVAQQLRTDRAASPQAAVAASERASELAHLATPSTGQSKTQVGSHKPPRGPGATGAMASFLVTGLAANGDEQPATPAMLRADQVNASVRMEMAASGGGGADASMAVSPAAKGLTAAASNVPLQNTFAGAFGHGQGDSLLGTPPGATARDDEAFSGQVVRGLSAMMNQRGGVMNMRLNPPELGELRVQMTLARGVVSAEFQATTAQAHSLLERNLTSLRAALESQGLSVDRLHVHAMPAAVSTSGRDDASNQWNSSQSPSQHRSDHDAANGESRGRQEQSHDAPGGAERRHRAADFADLFADVETNLAELAA
jgi:flagellar hook-length control protein FliK